MSERTDGLRIKALLLAAGVGARLRQLTDKTPTSDLANAGVYAVTAEAYREMADMDRFDLGHDVLPRFVGRMLGWKSECFHLDIGTTEALERANREADAVFGSRSE